MSSEYLQLSYSLNLEKFGWRRVDLLIATRYGKTSSVAKQLLSNEEVTTSHVPSSNNRPGLSHWKGRPVIALEDRIPLHGQLPSRLEYFPDDFDQTLTYLELPYYRYEFERKKRRLEAKGRSDGWLNDEVGYGAICHDSRGNLVDG